MEKCCNSCAFLQCNKDKPNLITLSTDDAQWYSQEQMDRLWNDAARYGQFLTCHSTDPRYFAKTDDKVTVCLGFALCVFMHIKIYESVGCKYGKYKNAVGHKVALTQRGLGEAIFSIAMGCADLFGQIKIARQINEDRPMRYPTGFEKTITLFKQITNQ